MSFGTRMLAEPVRTAAFGAVAAGYTAIGTPLVFQSRIMIFQNLTDVGVMISLDGGATDSFPLASNGMFVLDISSDRVTDEGLFLSKGSVIAQKRLSGAAASGSVYVSSFYAYGDNN